MGKNYFSKGLIVFQFSLTIFLIIGAIAIFTQLRFLSSQHLGYNASNLVKINIPNGTDKDRFATLLRSELASEQQIIKIAAKNNGTMSTAVHAAGKQIDINYSNIDENYHGRPRTLCSHLGLQF